MPRLIQSTPLLQRLYETIDASGSPDDDLSVQIFIYKSLLIRWSYWQGRRDAVVLLGVVATVRANLSDLVQHTTRKNL